MIPWNITYEFSQSEKVLILFSMISGILGFIIEISVSYTPIPLAIAIILLMILIPGVLGYTNQSFGVAIVSSAIPFCLVLWAPFTEVPISTSRIWIHASVWIVGFGAVLPFATISYMAGLSLYDRSALRDKSRYLIIRVSFTALLFLTIMAAYLQGIFASGRVD
jgi:ABC-type Na+ efflux pump permease subunit